MIQKIVRLFENGLTGDSKRDRLNSENLRQPIRMQLSQKQRTFSELVFGFLKSVLIFIHFPKQGDSHSSCFSEITGSEHGNSFETLLESERMHLYHIY